MNLADFCAQSKLNDDVNFHADTAIGAETFALFYFGAFSPQMRMIKTTMQAIEQKLWIPNEIGGVARFENDGYMRVSDEING